MPEYAQTGGMPVQVLPPPALSGGTVEDQRTEELTRAELRSPDDTDSNSAAPTARTPPVFSPPRRKSYLVRRPAAERWPSLASTTRVNDANVASISSPPRTDKRFTKGGHGGTGDDGEDKETAEWRPARELLQSSSDEDDTAGGERASPRRRLAGSSSKRPTMGRRITNNSGGNSSGAGSLEYSPSALLQQGIAEAATTATAAAADDAIGRPTDEAEVRHKKQIGEEGTVQGQAALHPDDQAVPVVASAAFSPVSRRATPVRASVVR